MSDESFKKENPNNHWAHPNRVLGLCRYFAGFHHVSDHTDLYENVLEGLNLYYEDQGIDLTTANLKLQLDLQQFFQHYRVLNASFLASRIGMNPTLLSQYVQGNKRPSAKQTRRILQGIQSIGQELADLQFI